MISMETQAVTATTEATPGADGTDTTTGNSDAECKLMKGKEKLTTSV